ncbi:carbohydrate kinase, partial [Paenibacillus sepulcri]|nr:carbohydrate kinase [Paenibacillus sepulcri]
EGDTYDSIGTAETLVGMETDRPLTKEDFASGLSYGLHIVPGLSFWMGGISASGGSIEWMRGILGEQVPLSYEDVIRLVDKAPDGPTNIMYFPYLSGCGAPMPDANARGAFIGLTADHGQPHLLKAVLEGAAFQMEAIRRAAARASGTAGGRIVAVGGGTRNEAWMRIKADISGCRIDVPDLDEATLLGAALTAAIGTGIYRDAADAVRCAVNGRPARVYKPDNRRREAYCRIFEHGYLAIQQPLRDIYRQLTKELEKDEERETN